MDCSPPGSSVHGILQARMLEWAATLQGSSWPRFWIHVSCVSCTGMWILYQESHLGHPRFHISALIHKICFSFSDLSPSVWQRSLCKLAGIALQETQALGFRSWSSHLLALWTWANYSTSLISTSSALQWEWIPCSGGFQGRLQTLRQTSHEDGQWGLLSWSEAVSAGSPSPQKWHPSLQETSAELQSHTCLSWVPLLGRDPSARESLGLEGRLSVSSLMSQHSSVSCEWWSHLGAPRHTHHC